MNTTTHMQEQILIFRFFRIRIRAKRHRYRKQERCHEAIVKILVIAGADVKNIGD